MNPDFTPDFTYEEAGYEALYKLFKMAEEIQKKPPVVVDALDLEENPYDIIKKYCEQVNIPFIQEALHWKPGEIKAWSVWKEWHLAFQSNYFNYFLSITSNLGKKRIIYKIFHTRKKVMKATINKNQP